MQATMKLREELLVKLRVLIGQVIKEQPISVSLPEKMLANQEIGLELELGIEKEAEQTL